MKTMAERWEPKYRKAGELHFRAAKLRTLGMLRSVEAHVTVSGSWDYLAFVEVVLAQIPTEGTFLGEAGATVGEGIEEPETFEEEHLKGTNMCAGFPDEW